MADPRLARRATGGAAHGMAPRGSLPLHATGRDTRRRDLSGTPPAQHHAGPPHAAAASPLPPGQAWGHPVAGWWSPPQPPKQHSSSLLGRAGQVVDHALAAQGHDLMRHAYKHMAKAHANWSGDTAYFQAAHAFHAGQVHSHQQAAWHQVSQVFRPSTSAYAGPGPMFNPGWLAQAATLPTVRQALHAAVDTIQRLFRR